MKIVAAIQVSNNFCVHFYFAPSFAFECSALRWLYDYIYCSDHYEALVQTDQIHSSIHEWANALVYFKPHLNLRETCRIARIVQWLASYCSIMHYHVHPRKHICKIIRICSEYIWLLLCILFPYPTKLHIIVI